MLERNKGHGLCLAHLASPCKHTSFFLWRRKLWFRFLGSSCRESSFSQGFIVGNISWNAKKTTFLTDCTNLIMALQNPMFVPSSIYWTIRKIKHLAVSFLWCFILKVNNQQVQRAHDTAQMCARTCLQSRLLSLSLCSLSHFQKNKKKFI